MSGWNIFLYVMDAVIVPINLILWCSIRRRQRFNDNMTPVLWEASDRLGDWQHRGLVTFQHETPLKRAGHLWKLCDDKDKGMAQYRLGLLAGPNGYAVYNIMLARRKFWQVL